MPAFGKSQAENPEPDSLPGTAIPAVGPWPMIAAALANGARDLRPVRGARGHALDVVPEGRDRARERVSGRMLKHAAADHVIEESLFIVTLRQAP